MANCILSSPNYLDVQPSLPLVPIYVRMGGGSWLTARPLTNLRAVTDLDRFLKNTARSTNATTAYTKLYGDLGANRSIRVTAIPRSNIKNKAATIRVRYMTAPVFSGCTMNAITASGVSSITFKAGSVAATITTGDLFTVNNNSTVYTAGTTTTISAGGTASIAITPNLADNAAAAEVITCITGNLSTVVYDSGYTDVWRAVFDLSTLSYFDPHFYDLKFTDEERNVINMPWFDVADDSFYARYFLLEVVDSGNSDGYIDLAKLVISPGYQPTINMSYGTTLGWSSNTTVTKSDITKFFRVREGERRVAFQIANIPTNEAFGFDYEIKRALDLSGQLFFIFNPDESTNRHRFSFLATIEEISPTSFDYFDGNKIAYQLTEVIS